MITVSTQLLTLAASLTIINILWQTPKIWLAVAARRWLGDPTIGRAISRLSGAVLLIFAALMLYDNLR